MAPAAYFFSWSKKTTFLNRRFYSIFTEPLTNSKVFRNFCFIRHTKCCSINSKQMMSMPGLELEMIVEIVG